MKEVNMVKFILSLSLKDSVGLHEHTNCHGRTHGTVRIGNAQRVNVSDYGPNQSIGDWF